MLRRTLSRLSASNVHQDAIDTYMRRVTEKNTHEPEFLQAVQEVADILVPFVEESGRVDYIEQRILHKIIEPERVIMFRVPWQQRDGTVRIARGYRVEFNSALGPYKGGLRFHPSVNLSILKFLGFEQTFKNSLTGLPMGGGKGGSDFNPRGKTNGEVMNFCQSFMTELQRHIGPHTDIPAGDIGVGGREIGYLFGQYKRIRNEFTGVLTGKNVNWGGSLIRPEATGYGTVYFANEMMKTRSEGFLNKEVVISGSGNVAQFAAEKATSLGAKVVTLSDSTGFLYDPDGINEEKLEFVKNLITNERKRIREYTKTYPSATFYKDKKPWSVKCDIALPCATQNEISQEDAAILTENGCVCVAEGANMPSTPGAVHVFSQEKVLFAPGKASNAGGVATSGLEMAQNAIHSSWPREKVEAKLRDIMLAIHENCVSYGRTPDGYVDYVRGANIAGFVKIADAMLDQGLV